MKRLLAFLLILSLLGLCAGCAANIQAPTPTPSPSNPTPVQVSFTPADLETRSVELADAIALEFALAPDGTVYYRNRALEIRKVDPSGNDTLFLQPSSTCFSIAFYEGKLYTLTLEDTWVLSAYGADGACLKAYPLTDIPVNRSLGKLAFFSDTLAYMKVEYEGLSASVDFYIYDLSKEDGKLYNLTGRYGKHDRVYPMPGNSVGITYSEGAQEERWTKIITFTNGEFAEDPSREFDHALYQPFYDAVDHNLYAWNTSETGTRLFIYDAASLQYQYVTEIPGQWFANSACAGGYFACMWQDQAGIDLIPLGALAAQTKAQESVTLRVLMDSALSSGGSNSRFYDYFVKKYPNLKIQMIPLDPEDPFAASILTALLAGELELDLLLLGEGSIYNFLNSGVLMDLRDVPEMAQMYENPNLLEGTAAMCTGLDGALFGVPFEMMVRYYVCNAPLFKELGLSLPDLNWSTDDYLKLAEQVAEIQKARPEIYLQKLQSGNFHFDPTYGITQSHGFALEYLSPAFARYVSSIERIEELGCNLDASRFKDRWITENILVKNDSSRSFMGFYPESTVRDQVVLVTPPVPKDLITGDALDVNFLCMARNAPNPEWALRVLADFFSESFQKESWPEQLIYKDVSGSRVLRHLPPEAEGYIANAILTYDNCFMVPRLWYWMNVDLYPQYRVGRLTLEEVIELLHKEAEKRMQG